MSQEDYNRQQEWDNILHFPFKRISYVSAHSQAYNAYMRISTANFKDHMRTTTIFFKGIHSAIDDSKQIHQAINGFVDKFMANTSLKT